jgi:hypothetical protein
MAAYAWQLLWPNEGYFVLTFHVHGFNVQLVLLAATLPGTCCGIIGMGSGEGPL